MGRLSAKSFLIVFLIVLVASPLWAEEHEKTSTKSYFGSDYLIGPGDLLDISVWKNPELTKQLPVLPDGKIAFPLIGELVVAGKSVAQVTKETEDKLARYMPDPTLSISVTKVNSLLIYVIGKVNGPGMFAFNTNVNVLQALAMAKGLNAFAKKGKIKIFRVKDGETLIFDFEYDEVSEGKNLEQNIQLQRGDIIVVP